MRRFVRDQRRGAAETYLNQSAGGCRVGSHEPNVIHTLMLVKPIDHIPSDVNEIRPLLDSQSECEMGRAGVGDSHEHTPEDHVYTGVKHEQKT